MSHPSVDALDRVVLLLSNKQEADRHFIEAPQGKRESGIKAEVAKKRLDIGWFDQAWFAEQVSQNSKDGKTTRSYSIRNLRTGSYLQSGTKLPDGSSELELATRIQGPGGKHQTWFVSEDKTWARIMNAKTGQVVELVEGDGPSPKLILKNNEPQNTETQTWVYERVSRAASDIWAAVEANDHMPKVDKESVIKYQNTDATYITLPPQVRDQIWKSSGLGSGNLVWRNQLFDCDDFAFAAKAAVSRWAAENLVGSGFTILFGITFAERKTGEKIERHAYNWYLNWEDLKSVVFFEPMTGDESDDGWKYKGFNGIF